MGETVVTRSKKETALATAYDFAFAGMTIKEISFADSIHPSSVEQHIRYALTHPDEFKEYVIKHG